VVFFNTSISEIGGKMICPNCRHKNPEGAKVCEECGANFEKTVTSPEKRNAIDVVSSFTTCLTTVFSYSIVAILIALTVAAVLVFNCKHEVSPAPEQGYPASILSIWEYVYEMQVESCPDLVDPGG